MFPGGIDKQLQAEIKKKESAMPDGIDHRNKKIYDVNSNEARKILAGQKVQGYTPSFGYIEKSNLFELYIPVPKVSKPALSGKRVGHDWSGVSLSRRFVIAAMIRFSFVLRAENVLSSSTFPATIVGECFIPSFR